MFKRMLVPLDGSKTAEEVLPHVRRLAQSLKLPVELLSVLDIADFAVNLSSGNARFMDAMIEAELKNRTNYLSGLVGTFEKESVTCAIEKGRADEVILDKAVAQKKTLLAMATHGRSGLNRWLLGSVAEKVLRATAAPLLLVRAKTKAKSGSDASLKSIVVPLDGSELAECALPAALELAKTLDLEVVLLRAYQLPISALFGSEDFPQKYQDLRVRVKADSESYLAGKVAALKGKGLEKVTAAVVEGQAAEQIVEQSNRRPGVLVVMCTHGRSGVRRWVLGSVTEKIVRHCSAPLLVISARAAKRPVIGTLGEEVSGAMRYTID